MIQLDEVQLHVFKFQNNIMLKHEVFLSYTLKKAGEDRYMVGVAASRNHEELMKNIMNQAPSIFLFCQHQSMDVTSWPKMAAQAPVINSAVDSDSGFLRDLKSRINRTL